LADGLWGTPGGAVTDAIGLPRPEAAAVVSRVARAAANCDQDAAWLEHALDVVREVAREHKHLTVDDCWAKRRSASTRPTPDERADGRRAEAGADPAELRPQALARPTNRGRSVRVWRSLTYRGEP
jgi:hypothetical protein